MRVEAGEWVALTGPSGRGKSTLLKLVLGFMAPEAGRILLAGSPVLDSLDKIALVSQRTNLWHGSLADNLRIARPHATEQEVVAALQAAALNLPPTTMVGDLSHGLSGGQARRVALARAYLANRPLLLLDEPTAGLDSETAAQLLASLRQLASQRTVLMVSHDPQALAAADRVVNL
jgi:ATP-binding cassette subfamily C protein CydCD